ncbi:MAG: hypothetical protein P8Y99_18490 [Calditrichaceae bacterium]|jgi:hypothetical protein
MIKTTLKNLELISSYLHDAVILSDKDFYEQKQKIFSLNLKRIYYENGHKEKFFFIVPINKFQTITSKLLVTEVISVSQTFVDKKLNTWGEHHRLLGIELNQNNNLLIISEHLELMLSVTNNSKIIIEDTSIPSKKYLVNDLSGTVFTGLKDIEKLKCSK